MLLGLLHLRGYVYIFPSCEFVDCHMGGGGENFKYQRRNRVEVEMVK